MRAEQEARDKEDRLGAMRPWQTEAQDRLLKYVKDDLQWDKDLMIAMEKKVRWKPNPPFSGVNKLFLDPMPPREGIVLKHVPQFDNGASAFGKSIMSSLSKSQVNEVMRELARGRPGWIAVDVESNASIQGHMYDFSAFDEYWCKGPSRPTREDRLLLLCE